MLTPRRLASTKKALALPLTLTLTLGLLAQTACSKRAEPPSARAASVAAPAALPASETQAVSPLPEERAMRVTVDMTIVVAHRDDAVARLRAALAQFGGYVSSGSVSGLDGTGGASFELKVPASRVEAFRAVVSSLGEVRADNEKAEDVTEARADVRARLANARAEESRMVALLGEKTGNLADVVALEKEVSRVRETIERFEAEERVLLGQIAMATVKVQVETSYVALDPTPRERLASAAKEGVDTAWAFLVGTGVFLLASGPTLLLLAFMVAALFFTARFARRRLQRARMVAAFSEPRV
jgi:hypothetical protein